MLRQRLLFGSLMIAALAGIVLADAWLSADIVRVGAYGSGPSSTAAGGFVAWRCGFVLTALVAALAVGAVYELSRLCEAGGYRPVRHWAALVSLALVLTPWVQALVRVGALSWGGRASDSTLLIVVLAVGFLGSCMGVLARRTTEQAVAGMAVTLFVICYLGVLASFAIGIRFLWLGPAGAAALVYFILTVKFGDIGAFFVGSAVGRHKLVPWLSPGKTWEGVGGAILGSVLMAELGLLLWRGLGHWLGPAPLTAAQALFFGLLMAVFGHAGDLVESAIKRDVGTKDSAHVVPAFGGLLDILDSPLFAAPIAWWFLTFCSGLG